MLTKNRKDTVLAFKNYLQLNILAPMKNTITVKLGGKPSM